MIGYYQLVLGGKSLFTPGVIYRGIILTPFLFVAIFLLRGNRFRVIVSYFMLIFILGLFVHFMLGYNVEIVGHLQRFLKIIFPILGFGTLVFLAKRFPDLNNDGFMWKTGSVYGLITAISVVIFFISGKSLSTYNYGFSSIATFDGQNSVSIILVITLPVLLYYIKTFQDRLLILLTAETIYLFSAFLIGTRTAIIGVVITIMAFNTFILFRKRNHKRMPRVVYGLIVLGVIALIGFAIYQFWNQQDVRYITNKFSKLAKGEFRAQVPDGIDRISDFSEAEHLFGIGNAEFILTENDLVDIYGKFGLLILIPLLIFFSYYYLNLLPIFIRKRSLSVFALLISLTFYIAHASLAGHALASAQVNNMMMVIYYLVSLEIWSSRKVYMQKEPYVLSE